MKDVTGKDHWGNATPEQQEKIQDTFGAWPAETACVRQGCAHGVHEACWEQPAIYPVATLQPCLYQPKVMELLPEPLRANRRQWLHICLLAKLYRLSAFLHFSEISPYRNILHLRNEGAVVEFDAYLFCLLYTVGRLIDARGHFPAKYSFLPAYDQADTFDWKFETMDCRDRTFHQYEKDGEWEEEVNPFVDRDAYLKSLEKAAENPGRKPIHTLKLLYIHYDVPKFTPSPYHNAYQQEVMQAFALEHAKYEIAPENNKYIRDA
ncbi:hypothetical protein PG985_000387 [Apiospora marii]|uniref:uncharacterized protein n=1 Tax=Apiospora marii TaxID=335849 RepID=UPI003130BCB6